ncbi:MAG: hypothetical protein GF408_05255 [Candidatus Omnitrophica bacterium]|nr:hypothetical protein [Candidatus Omnitrophota bacterium]
MPEIGGCPPPHFGGNMKVPLELSFRDVPHSEEIKQMVREKAAKLDEFCDHLNSCRVAVEKTQKHQDTGNPYRVRLDMTIAPGHEIAVRRETLRR